jgi:DNA-binding transcriptional LysR family regulator
VEASIDLRQLRYFVAVAEELHFGRAAERLHISQSPLSRAIRELERDIGVVLFVRTTRRVELTEAGSLLLERSRRALAEIDGAIADARGLGRTNESVLGIGYGPFSAAVVTRIVAALRDVRPELEVRLDEEVTPASLRRLGTHELSAAVVMESPAARRLGLRLDTLRDEPLLAVLSASHPRAGEDAISIGDFAAERVLLPREPTGEHFNAWLTALIRVHGFELERTLKTLSAPWDRRMLPVANGEAVSLAIAEWAEAWDTELVGIPFDPPLTLPTDLASRWPASESVAALVETARRVRDAEGWLTERTDRTELPDD